MLASAWLLLPQSHRDLFPKPGRTGPTTPRMSICLSLTCTAGWLERSEKGNLVFLASTKNHQESNKTGFHSLSPLIFAYPSSLVHALCNLHFHRKFHLSFRCTIHQGKARHSKGIRSEKLGWISPCGKVVPGSCTHFINYKVSLYTFLALCLVLVFIRKDFILGKN